MKELADRTYSPEEYFAIVEDAEMKLEFHYGRIYDRTDKFRFYRGISSLKEYLVISADKPLVETFFKEEEGLWRIASAKGLDQSIHLSTFNIDLPLSNICAKVDELTDSDQFLSNT